VSNPTTPAAAVERQFSPPPSLASRVGLGLVALGCAALGAAVYGLWLAPDPVAGSGWILGAGALLGGLGAGLGARRAPLLRVGPFGITLGDPRELPRVPWCDMQRIHVAGEALRIETAHGSFDLPFTAYGPAIARILAEAAARIGERVDVSPRAHERLPALSETAGEIVPAGRLQVAGRKCLASGSSLTFETDARWCDNCAALYHRQHLPVTCASCGRPLSGSAASAARAS
jgi:hypothetical protein